MNALVVDLFAGPGGWSQGLRNAGFDGVEVGLEWDHFACRTAVAAGHPRVRCDVAAYPTTPFVQKAEGLIGSPPCPAFSSAGQGAGKRLVSVLCTAMTCLGRGDDVSTVLDETQEIARKLLAKHAPKDEGAEQWARDQALAAALTLQPLRWALAIKPRWVALEQVPEVLPLWEHMARVLREHGYSVATAVVNAANYGVPQTRRRAILVARCDGLPAELPTVTHSENGAADLFGGMPKWVSMAEALGWDGAALKRDRGRGMAERHGDRPPRPMSMPAPTITCGIGGAGTRMSWTFMAAGVTGQGRPRNPSDRPADTITAKATAVWVVDGRTERRVSVQEAALFQSFPADYPWAGTQEKRYQQVGNAVCPALAAAVLRPLLVVERQAVAA